MGGCLGGWVGRWVRGWVGRYLLCLINRGLFNIRDSSTEGPSTEGSLELLQAVPPRQSVHSCSFSSCVLDVRSKLTTKGGGAHRSFVLAMNSVKLTI